MERAIHETCRRRFIRWRLRVEHQKRMDFDCKLRMQAQVRAGKLHAILWSGEFESKLITIIKQPLTKVDPKSGEWTIWREGNRGYLVPVTRQRFSELSSAVAFIWWQTTQIATVMLLLICCLVSTANAQKTYQNERSSSILQVRFKQAEGLESVGTCVMVDPTHALTAAHVVGASDAIIKAVDGDIDAKVVAIDMYHDRALLRAAREVTTRWRVLREEFPAEGETVFAIGHGGRGYGYTRGRASKDKLLCTAVEGDSGGPVVDQEGRIVGIITGYSGDGTLLSLGRRSLRTWTLKNIGNQPLELGSKE